MVKITVKDVLENCDAKLLIGDKDKEIKEGFINSKEVVPGGCFFGIKGSNTDGSLYYKEAFKNGADICVLSKLKDLDLKGYDDKTVLISNDVKKCLQDIAAYKRSLFKGCVIAVTGSVGKTSTKEMIANVLKHKYKVLKTIGNQNSQIGLPITILRLTNEDVMVLEMGMSSLGHIHNLSVIAKPDIALITNIHENHIESLENKENILKAKMEIIDGMDSGYLIVNNDDDYLSKIEENIKDGVKLLTFGIDNLSNVMPCNIKDDFITTFDIADIKDFKVNFGTTFIYNALPAFLIGKMLGLSRGMIKDGINTFITKNHRLEEVNINNNVTLIDDTYNASFDSMKLAIGYLNKFNKRKILVLADVLELGKESKIIHKKIGKELSKINIDYLITIGKYSKIIAKEAKKSGFNVKHFKREEKSRSYLKKLIKKDDVILIKGSHGMNLINLVNYLKEELTL